MQRRLKLFILTLAGASLLATACAPKQKQLILSHPPLDFKPRNADADVKSQGLFSTDFDQAVAIGNGLNTQVKPAFVYRLSENMLALGLAEKNDDLSANGQKILNKVLDLPGLASTTTADKSPYVQLAISETRTEVDQALTEVDRQLKTSVEKLNIILNELGVTYPWPSGPSSLTQAGKTVSGFLAAFLENASGLDIFDALKAQLQVEIGTEQKWIEDLTAQVDQELHTVKHFPDLMNYLVKLLKDQQLNPPDSVNHTLMQGKLLAQDLASCDSEQSVLTAVIDVWNMLDDKEREQYIKPESESLYKYLKKRDEGDLKCLRSSTCVSPVKFFVKKVFLLPRIGKMGVDKLCASIDQSALNYVITASQTMVPQIYPQLPSFVSDALNKAIADKMKVLNDIHHDYAGFLKTQIQKWATTSLLGKGQIRGIDAGNLKVSLKNKELQMQTVAGTSSAEVVGTSMAALAQYFAHPAADEARVQQSSFDLVNELVALGGYTTEFGTLTPALLTPLEKSAPLLDLTHLTTQNDPYALPDQFTVVSQFVPKETHPANYSLSARSQAELIRGLSKVIGYLSDWKASAYDKTLGGITAAALVPEYKDINELQRSMFPKAELMTLAIGDLAVTLENLTKKMAQVFVIGLHDNKITWVNDYDLDKGELVAMAGVVDINNGVRASVVKSQDLARWILAMSEFIKNSEGIEQTKSDILLEKDAGGATSLDSLVKARRQLKLLTVAFANLLSHQMVDKDGLVMSQLKLTDLVTDAGQKSLLDQAMAIQALVAAADATGVSIYRVAATELYYSLNSKKYVAKMHFYSMSGKPETIDLETLTETARAISDLKASLPEKSQTQADWILNPWLKGLAEIQ